ncbi:MAG: hypothetical protein Q8Q33_08860 [Chlamydiota bacterium]|nr:hypothetical protein [Chlamydiota bacterium]
MKKIQRFTIMLGMMLAVMIQTSLAFAGNYDRTVNKPRAYSANPYGYHPESGGYPNYPGPGRAQIYYACPYGDYISDRQGSCPIHNTSLVQKRPVQR